MSRAGSFCPFIVGGAGDPLIIVRFAKIVLSGISAAIKGATVIAVSVIHIPAQPYAMIMITARKADIINDTDSCGSYFCKVEVNFSIDPNI